MREQWEEIELGKIFKIVSGNTPKGLKEISNDGKIPFYKVGDMNHLGNEIHMRKSNTVLTPDEFKNLKLKAYPKGTVIFPKRGGAILTNKKRVLSSDAAFDLNIMGVPPVSVVNNAYQYYWFLKLDLSRIYDGSNIPQINNKNISPLRFQLPPLPEQRAIVAKVEVLFSDLDQGIADLKKSQEQLKVYRQAVLKKAFEGELTREWREKNELEPSLHYLKKIANQRKQAEVDKSSIYHKKVSHEFEFSQDCNIETWSKGTLDKLIYIAARIGWRGLKKSEYTEIGPLFLSVHSLNHGKYIDYSEAFHITEERYNESPEIQLEEGDVLLCKDGAGIGKIGIVKDLPDSASVNSSILVIRGMGILDQEFIYYLFSGPKLQSIVAERITGSATPHLFQNDIRQFELLIPPLVEQHQIVQEIESRLSVCDKIEQSIYESLEKAQALRQSILKKAFEGSLLTAEEIEKCKQEKDWEPASVLLERIKSEKRK